MKVVALVSGGKDSCFNMMQCQKFGHEIVALANLLPAEAGVDELDSFMFQTVGHQLVAAYAECTGLPLFRRRIKGSSRNTDMRYAPTAKDEVEDLAALLAHVKQAMPGVEAVSSGAIASDYQRLRVESVCSRLGLVSLAYLWKQPQDQLLQDMIDSGIDAVLVKVAALGLRPEVHLGQSLQQMQGTLRGLASRFGLNVCGEGGEYETLTLDCPLFTRGRIVLDNWHVVEVSADPGGAPVAHMSVDAFHVERKQASLTEQASAHPHLPTPLPSSDGSEAGEEKPGEPGAGSSETRAAEALQYSFAKPILVEDSAPPVPESAPPKVHPGQPRSNGTHSISSHGEESPGPGPHPVVEVCSRPSGSGLMLLRCRGPAPLSRYQPGAPAARQSTSTEGQLPDVAAGRSGTPGAHQELSPEEQTGEAVGGMLGAVRGVLGAQGLSWDSALYIRLYLADMAHFGCANRAYSAAIPEAECPLGVPSRATVEVPSVTEPDQSPAHSDALSGAGDAGGAGDRSGVSSAVLDVLVARELAEGGCRAEGPLRGAQGVPGAECSESAGRTPDGLGTGWREGESVKSVLHVKSISSWAPSCIGPYSQCTRYRNLLFMAGQLGLDPPTMELIRPTPHPHPPSSKHTTGTPTTTGSPTTAPVETQCAVQWPPGASSAALSVAAAEARRALLSCQAVTEAMGASCGAHSLSAHVYCSPALGYAERQGLWAELSAFFGSQGKRAGVPSYPKDSGNGDCVEGGVNEEEEEEEVDELRGLRGRFRGMWTPERSGEATGAPGFSISPALVFLSVPALPKGAAVEIAPLVYSPTTATSEHPEEGPKALNIAACEGLVCSGHAIFGQLCSVHLFAPQKEGPDGGQEPGAAASLVPKLGEALEASGLAWDDVAELRVHYDQQIVHEAILETMLTSELADMCAVAMLPVCVPVSAIHAASPQGALGPVAVHAQMLALKHCVT